MNTPPDSSAERVRQIHQAALTCFGRKGYHRATMDDIVAESGLSKGTLYWYFPSKKDLFLSLFEEIMDQFAQGWSSVVIDRQEGALEKLRTSISFFRLEMAEMSPLLEILLEAWSLLRHDQEIERRVREFYRPYTEIMEGIIREGVSEGVFTVENPKETALVIITLFDGIYLAISTGLDLGDWDQILNAAEQLILRGLGVSEVPGG